MNPMMSVSLEIEDDFFYIDSGDNRDSEENFYRGLNWLPPAREQFTARGMRLREVFEVKKGDEEIEK